MNINIYEVEKEDKLVLERLIQLYLHNISMFFSMDIDSNIGLYKYDDINKF